MPRTRRRFEAAKSALTGLLANGPLGPLLANSVGVSPLGQTIAEESVRYADALLAALDGKETV